ncbi:MAG: class I SAM-dependent methyltransferase [Pseudomonadota bacterium]
MHPADPSLAAEPFQEHRQPDPRARLASSDKAAPVPAVAVPSDAAPSGAVPAPGQPPHKQPDKIRPLKKLERYLAALFKFGRTEWTAKQALRQAQALEAQTEARLAHLTSQLDHHAARFSEIGQQLDQLRAAQGQAAETQTRAQAGFDSGLAVLSRTVSDLTQRLDRLMLHRAAAEPQAPPSEPTAPDGLSAFKDQFYHRLENQFRGSRAEIIHRLRIYLPDVTAAVKRTGGKPVLDLGCGRGEWLEVLKTAGILAQGVDTNAVQCAEAAEQGLDVRLQDAQSALRHAEDASLSVVSAHHLVEHLPFDTVAWIVREALRVLAPGGLLLLETPNTRNVLVGATTFHTDPTHLKPMPAQVLSVLFETAGFDPVELRHLNAHERLDEFLTKPDVNDELAYLLFGPQDLAVLGHLPQRAG